MLWTNDLQVPSGYKGPFGHGQQMCEVLSRSKVLVYCFGLFASDSEYERGPIL